MKTWKHGILAVTARYGILIGTLLVCTACFSEYQPENAVITLKLGGPAGSTIARAAGELAARPEFAVSYTVELSGPSGRQTRKFQGAQAVQITVVPGAWDITLDAYTNDNELYARGSVTGFPVKAGQNNTVVIDMYPAQGGGPTPIPATVTFSANGGSGAPPAAQTVASGSSITLPSGSGLTKSGYTFGGWNTNTSGTGTNYAAGSSYTVTASITLYARWITAATTPVTVSSVTLNKTTLSLNVGDTETLTATVQPTNASNKSVSWSSDNTSVATVDANGKVDAKAAGTAIITVKTDDGNKTAACNVTVTTPSLIEMVQVSGGSFQMGKDLGTGAKGDVTPVHAVTVSGFYMGTYQITQAQYAAVMGTNPSSGYGVGDNYPVYNVSWYDALVFCNKLSMEEGLSPAYSISGSTDPAVWETVPTSSNATWDAAVIEAGSNGYRLPTEAQWEYAAKGGDPTAAGWVGYTYSGSDTVGDVAWYLGNNGSIGTDTYRTKVVGTKDPNGLGLYDMSGNVWEWCWDWKGTYSSGAQTDPQGASSGSRRVYRGGYWNYSAEYIRSVYRNYDSPTYRSYDVGFRVVRPAQ